MINDEPAFAARLGPALTATVDKVARAMCNASAMSDDGPGCTCGTDRGTCLAFGLYGDLALAAVKALGE